MLLTSPGGIDGATTRRAGRADPTPEVRKTGRGPEQVGTDAAARPRRADACRRAQTAAWSGGQGGRRRWPGGMAWRNGVAHYRAEVVIAAVALWLRDLQDRP